MEDLDEAVTSRRVAPRGGTETIYGISKHHSDGANEDSQTYDGLIHLQDEDCELGCEKLFLMYGCPQCAEIKSTLSDEAVFDNAFRTEMGQKFNIFYAFSNNAARELLNGFDLQGYFMPVLITYSGEVYADAQDIIAYLADMGATET